MALVEGRDYVFCEKTTYMGSAGAGTGTGCLIGTQNSLLMIPLKLQHTVWNSKITTSTFNIGGDNPVEAIQNLLQDHNFTTQELEGFIQDISQQISEAEYVNLTEMSRVNVRTGFLSKGVYCNPKASGLGGWKGFPINDKASCQKFYEFYKTSTKFSGK